MSDALAQSRSHFNTRDWLLAQARAGEAEGWWSPREILRLSSQRGARLVLLLWALVTVIAVASGILVVALDWSGIPLDLGGRTIHVTVYPPLVIGMLMFLWLGPLWAMVTTYVATFALGAYAGMGVLPNAIFAASDSILIMVVWSGMTVLETPPVLRVRRDLLAFLTLAFTGCVASSVGALVWNYTQKLAFSEALPVWEGWVLGALLKVFLVVLPIALLCGDRPQQWLERTLCLAPHSILGLRGGTVLLLSALALFGAMSVVVARLFADSLPPLGTDERRLAIAERLPELGLFTTIIFVSVFGTASLFIVVLTRRGERERLAARRDRLTGCRNRRDYSVIVAREENRATRIESPMSLIFIDLNDFKVINDRHGHLVGDRVLQTVSARATRTIRNTDYLFRWGGDEFVVLLPHTKLADAEQLAQRLVAAVSEKPVPTGEAEHPVAASIRTGVAVTGSLVNHEQLLAKAIEGCSRVRRDRSPAQ